MIELDDSLFPRPCGAESILMNAQKDAYDRALIPTTESVGGLDIVGYDEAGLVVEALRELRHEKGCACMEGTEVILNCEHLLEAIQRHSDGS